MRALSAGEIDRPPSLMRNLHSREGASDGASRRGVPGESGTTSEARFVVHAQSNE
jgi:hypothetical protein